MSDLDQEPTGREKRVRRRVPAAIAVGVALALLTAACGGDDGETSDTTSTSEASGGVAQGEPIVFGFHHLDGGAVAFPEVRVGLEAALEYINSELGGVNGRPLEVLACDTDLSPEASINCANKFVEEHVVVALQGADPGADAMLPILQGAGIAEVGYSPFGIAVRTDIDNSFFFGAAQPAAGLAAMSTLVDEGYESVTLVYADTPELRALVAESMQPAADALDLDLHITYYNVAAPDWTSIAASAIAEGTDVIGGTALQQGDCTSLISALVAQGYDGTMWASSCTEFIETVGADKVAGTILTSDFLRPPVIDQLSGDDKDELEAYAAAMEAAGSPDPTGGFEQIGFGITMDLYSVLAGIDGDVTPEAVLKAMRVASGKRFMAGPFDCENRPFPDLTSCSAGVVVYEVTETGSLSMLSDTFVDIDAYLPES